MFDGIGGKKGDATRGCSRPVSFYLLKITFGKDLHGFATVLLHSGSSMASPVPRASRCPLSSPWGASEPARCSPGRGSARVSFWPSREKPGWATLVQVQPLPSAQPWQQ